MFQIHLAAYFVVEQENMGLYSVGSPTRIDISSIQKRQLWSCVIMVQCGVDLLCTVARLSIRNIHAILKEDRKEKNYGTEGFAVGCRVLH